MADLEHRATAGLQSHGRVLSGYAAVFQSETRIGEFTERIAPGAFRDTLASGRDVLALADHDQRSVLGRTKSGTLTLSEDGHGLAYTLTLPDTQAGRDIAALAARGDLGGMSFGFVATDETWTGHTRELRAVELHEISVVQAWPAYQATSINLRNRPSVYDTRGLRYLWLQTC